MKKTSKSANARKLFAQGYSVKEVTNRINMNYGHAWTVRKQMLDAGLLSNSQQVEDDEPELTLVPPLTGGSSDYYKVHIAKPTSGGRPYMAECNDIIESLGMTFAEGNIMKALWRRAALRAGGGKPGSTSLYESEKIEFFAKRLVNADREYA